MHVEDEFGAAATSGQGGPEQKIGQGVDVDHANAGEGAVAGHEPAAAPHEGGVFEEIRKEAPARLVPWHPDNDRAVTTLHRALVCFAQGDDGHASPRVAERGDLAAHARISWKVREREVQDLGPHGAQLKGIVMLPSRDVV